MARHIQLKYEGKCKECGSKLAVGDYGAWYGRGVIYGRDCHKADSNRYEGWMRDDPNYISPSQLNPSVEYA